MRAVSPKRAKQLRTYSKLRRDFLEANPRCVWPLGCDQAASDVHHKAGRVGRLLLDVTRWAALCRGHHAYATEHPQRAYDLGISEHRIGAA